MKKMWLTTKVSESRAYRVLYVQLQQSKYESFIHKFSWLFRVSEGKIPIIPSESDLVQFIQLPPGKCILISDRIQDKLKDAMNKLIEFCIPRTFT